MVILEQANLLIKLRNNPLSCAVKAYISRNLAFEDNLGDGEGKNIQ